MQLTHSPSKPFGGKTFDSAEYFEGAHWRSYAAKKMAIEHGNCSCCGASVGDEPRFHHLNDGSFGHEEMDDVALLCRKCKGGLDYLISELNNPTSEMIRAMTVKIFSEARQQGKVHSPGLSKAPKKPKKSNRSSNSRTSGDRPKENIGLGDFMADEQRRENVHCRTEYQRIVNDPDVNRNPCWNGISDLGIVWYRKYLREVQGRHF